MGKLGMTVRPYRLQIGSNIVLADELAREVARLSLLDKTGTVDRWLRQVGSIGSAYEAWLSNQSTPELALGRSVQSKEAIALSSIAQWLNSGSRAPLRIRISPFVVEVRHARRRGMLEVVRARKALTPGQRCAITASLDNREARPASGSLSKLKAEVPYDPVAAGALATFPPPARLAAERVVARILLAVAAIGYPSTGRTSDHALIEQVKEALSDQPLGHPIEVTAFGVQVTFCLWLADDASMPFKIVEVKMAS